MITNKMAYWRSTMNQGKGISQAHLARQIGVSRSFVTKLEKGTAQPGAELMLRAALYFKQQVEAIFQLADGTKNKPVFASVNMIPSSQFSITSASVKPLCLSKIASSARPVEPEAAKDKSLVSPTAKAVASPVAQSSQRKTK